jgi:hypothetical protein
MPNARVRFAPAAPQDVPGTLQRTTASTVEWSSTDVARLVRVSGHFEMEFRLNPADCGFVRFAAQVTPVAGGCIVRTQVPLQQLVRYPATGTNTYQLQVEFVNWQTGFRIVQAGFQ